MKNFLHHFFIPHESNNHRAKLLHHDSLLVVFVLVLFVASLFTFFRTTQPAVLGIATSMTVDELISLTNKERQQAGLAPLHLNVQLSEAAQKKGEDMFTHNYWAHVSPSGTTPWYFIKNAGYDYLYAGENLARGFTTAPDTIKAWMASPSHRENMLSKNYDDVGFAILTGSLTGSDTVLVVESFGRKYVAEENPQTTPISLTESPVQSLPVGATQTTSVAAVTNSPLIDSATFSKQLGLLLLFIIIGVLALDAIIIARKRVARVVSHNLDHILFLTIMAIAVILLGKGFIL